MRVSEEECTRRSVDVQQFREFGARDVTQQVHYKLYIYICRYFLSRQCPLLAQSVRCPHMV